MGFARMKQAALCMALMAAMAGPARAQRPNTSAQTLLDRIQIEDLITSYYYNLGPGNHRGFGEFYVAEAQLDVNGQIAHGQAAIEELYRRNAGSRLNTGTFHMLLSDPLIEVNGDTATARFIWTGIINEAIKAPPRLAEQGREYDVLVKRGGRWLIAKRTIIADSGLPDAYDATYMPRKDFDPGTGR